MRQPVTGDLINIHTHGSVRIRGVFSVENLMLHEGRVPDDSADAFSAGIHPWFLQKSELPGLLDRLTQVIKDERVVAIGEAGYDHRRGPGGELQKQAFESQAKLAEECGKPLIIHCVKGWDELWTSRRRLRPEMPWIIHGFNGSTQQATQLVAGGFYLSLWVKSVLGGALNEVLAWIPPGRIFIETDGFDVELGLVYEKAAGGIGIPVSMLAGYVRNNYLTLFV